MSFFIAMQSQRATASYQHPQTLLHHYNEFLVVKRSGHHNEYLSVSTAGHSSVDDAEAPAHLRPDLTLSATFASKGPDDSELFVIERTPPEGQRLQGQYIVGDGCLFLRQSPHEISLYGVVRLKAEDQHDPMRQRCQLFGANEPGAMIHFQATHIPWSRELLPGGFQSKYPTGATE